MPKITIEFENVSDSHVLALLGQLSGDWPSKARQPEPERPARKSTSKAKAEPVEEPKAKAEPVEEPKAKPESVEEPKAKAEPVEPKAKAESVEEPTPDKSDEPVDAATTKQVVEVASAVIRAGHSAEIRAALDKVGAAKVSALSSKRQVAEFLAEIEPLVP